MSMAAGDIGMRNERGGADHRERIRHRRAKPHPSGPFGRPQFGEGAPRPLHHRVCTAPIRLSPEPREFDGSGQPESTLHRRREKGAIRDQHGPVQRDVGVRYLDVIAPFGIEGDIASHIRGQALRVRACSDDDRGAIELQLAPVTAMKRGEPAAGDADAADFGFMEDCAQR